MSVASCAILSNFFEEQWTHQNYPQYFLRLSRALFPKTFLEIAVSKSTLDSPKSVVSVFRRKQSLGFPRLFLAYSPYIDYYLNLSTTETVTFFCP